LINQCWVALDFWSSGGADLKSDSVADIIAAPFSQCGYMSAIGSDKWLNYNKTELFSSCRHLNLTRNRIGSN